MRRILLSRLVRQARTRKSRFWQHPHRHRQPARASPSDSLCHRERERPCCDRRSTFVFTPSPRRRNQSSALRTLVFRGNKSPRSAPRPPIHRRRFPVRHPAAVHVIFARVCARGVGGGQAQGHKQSSLAKHAPESFPFVRAALAAGPSTSMSLRVPPSPPCQFADGASASRQDANRRESSDPPNRHMFGSFAGTFQESETSALHKESALL